MSLSYLFLLFFSIITISALLCFPEISIQLVKESILIWYRNLLPVLFPAMILSNIIIFIFLSNRKKTSIRTYSIIVTILGFLCGFPIGAYLSAKLVRERKITPEDGQRLLGYCNNLGPVYLLNVYCAINNRLPKPMVLFIFYSVPLFYGLFYNKIPHREPRKLHPVSIPQKQNTNGVSGKKWTTELIDNSINDAISAIVRLAGYVIFFRLFLLPLYLFPINENLSIYMNELIEISSGIARFGSDTENSSNITCLLMQTLPFLSFGGLCCIGQTICLLKGSNLSIFTYLYDKIMQSTITFLLLLFFHVLS